jgi:hypothetical protein
MIIKKKIRDNKSFKIFLDFRFITLVNQDKLRCNKINFIKIKKNSIHVIF